MAAVLLLAGCSGLRSAMKPTSLPESKTATAQSFAPPITVVRPDGSTVIMAYETIAAIPPQTLDFGGGKYEHGPILLDFLTAAGVTQFTQATFFGLEDRSLTFTPDQLSDWYILALRNKSKAVNLMSPKLTEEQWVLHVSRVEVI